MEPENNNNNNEIGGNGVDNEIDALNIDNEGGDPVEGDFNVDDLFEAPQQPPEVEELEKPESNFKSPSDLWKEKHEQTPTVPKQPEQQRDYSQFDPEDVKVLKQFPNHIFNSVAPRLQAYRQSQQQILAEVEKYRKDPNRVPDNYYAHSEAYTLSPAYKSLETAYNKAAAEQQFWTQQLNRLKNINENTPEERRVIQVITGYNQQGQPIIQTLPADETAKLMVIQGLSKSQTEVGTLEGKATELQNGWKTQHEQALQQFTQITDQHFNGLIEPLRPIKEDEEKFLKVIPPAFQNHVPAPTAAKMFSVILRQGAFIAKLAKEYKALKAGKVDMLKAGPSARRSKPVNVLPGTEEISFESLKEEFEG